MDASGRAFVSTALSPLVAVLTSEDVDPVLQQSNFSSFLQFIRPFGAFNSKVQVRDSSSQAVSVEGFKLRFNYLDALDNFSSTVIGKVAVQQLRDHHRPLTQPPPLATKSDARDIASSVTVEELTPWYSRYRTYVSAHGGISEHEAFNHPVACLIVVSSSNPDPIKTMSSLFDPGRPHQAFVERPYLDHNIPKHYLLVNDVQKTGGQFDAESMLALMKKTFGLSCHVVSVNSIPKPTIDDPFAMPVLPKPVVADRWSASVDEFKPLYDSLDKLHAGIQTPPSAPSITEDGFPVIDAAAKKESLIDVVAASPVAPSVALGQYMSHTDIEAIESFMRDLLSKTVLPSMERSVQHWNEQIASSRRGITGRLFNAGRKYFGASAKPAGVPIPSTNVDGLLVFPFNSPEFLLRKLADYSFMLRDFKFASAIYDMARKDFQQAGDKACKYYAGTQEMLALCSLMSDAAAVTKGSIETLLDNAVLGYNDAKTPIYAARATMMVYEGLKDRSGHADAAKLLIKMTGEESDIRSGLFYEQAAHCHIRVAQGPMIRKYAFYLILAGQRFSKCSLRQHAYRCYTNASHVYSKLSWSLIDDHISFTLGRQSFHLGDLESSVGFFLKLLKESRQTAEQQASNMSEFLYIYKQYSVRNSLTNVSQLPKLPIPVINDSQIYISSLDEQFNKSSGAVSSSLVVEEEVWESMERDLIEEGLNNAEILGFKKKVTKAVTFGKTICAVQEPVFVSIPIHNPMQTPVTLEDVFLECTHDSVPDEQIRTIKVSILEAGVVDGKNRSRRISNNVYDVECLERVGLAAKETKTIQLRVLPKVEGQLQIVGLRYTFMNTIPAYRPFKKRGKRLNETLQQRSQASPQYSTDQTLKLIVNPPMPMLHAQFLEFPSSLLSGEVTRNVLEIENRGNKDMKRLILKMSHPTFFHFGRIGGSLSEDAYVIQPSDGKTDEDYVFNNSLTNPSIYAIHLPGSDESLVQVGSLGPGEKALIPVWVRGDRIGKHLFKFLFGYQSENLNDKISYRTLRVTIPTTVGPSLRINAFTRPSTGLLDEFILGVEIENLQQSSAKVRLTQISSMSSAWAITALDGATFKPDRCTISGKQTLFVYFRFVRTARCLKDAADTTPEAWTTKSVERLLSNDDGARSKAPDVHIHVASLGHDSAISFDSSPLQGLARHSRLQWKMNSLLNHYPGLTRSQVSDLFPLYFTEDVDLSLYWEMIPNRSESKDVVLIDTETATNVVRGHHYIIGINLGLQAPLQLQQKLAHFNDRAFYGKALFAATVREKRALLTSLMKSHQKEISPLRVILRAPDLHSHDFANGDCILPIQVSLRNSSWTNPINYAVEVVASSSSSESSKKFVEAVPFHWCGVTNLHGRLGQEEETTLSFVACFTVPGVYNLNQWRAMVTIEQPETTAPATAAAAAENVKHHDDRDKPKAIGAAANYVQTPSLPHIINIVGL
ncbi:ER-golgi trafficking TRAPP I complex 85 kDa subunit-domain-containing protein [Polychytrium aggregatum]|uniref:ER-golgi trafficking TRAPP I complex 85 kDa subunit-domain-containing protein n=1 Tax=Polychytrium aggregatum TaxID=110093 RepID=UPI0022FEAE77|nr:ER-golgi trafficking TRAPP I complex 85 kDa subunit-domain-containing protein [Polychytrium aggregatum]KAI9205332.1 ER-golgi trafficking TRAPP I complex 85 kDa subunit-domain-containing protein [Polychytrium aggregatum]